MYTPPRSSLGSKQSLTQIATGLLPIPGSHLRNRHGIKWIVDGHIKTSSLGTLPGDESELTAYPVIFPQNLSDRFVELLNEVARCTPKVILPLDTMPTVFPARAHPGGHSIDAWSHPEHIHIFVDAGDVSEVVLAHELAHAWIDLVRGIEDNRVWREREDTARYAQVQFMQSFVLDFAVDQVLDEKGFDRSQIVEDWEVASAQLRIAAERGYQPENRREAVFMASHLASTLVEESRDRLPVKVANLFPVVSRNLPEIFSLAKCMAQSVLDHFPADRGSARIAIDQILRSSFAFTDPGLDFESNLIHVEPEINWEMDKNPAWLNGQSVRAKCEIGIAMAKIGATSADTPVLHRENGGPILVSFKRPDGSVTEALPLEHAVMPPDPNISRINEMMEESRLAKARMEKMNRMNPTRQSTPPGPHLPSTGPAKPNFGPQLPNVPGFRPRSYSPGLARWLTRVRMEELLAGEHPYDYCGGNPTTYIDATGLQRTLPPPIRPPIPGPLPTILPTPLPAPTPAPTPGIGVGPAIIIVGGIIAIGDLIRWGCTGQTGPFTGPGTALGEWLFPGIDEMPAEPPECPRPPRTQQQADARRKELLQGYGKCKRFHHGPVNPAKRCPGGLHQTDLYWCGNVKVSASVICCPCVDKKGLTFYCRASVHRAT